MKIVLTLAAGSLLLCAAVAEAQPRTRQTQQNVTPAQVTAAERALTNRARALFRAAAPRSVADRLGVVRTVRQSAAAPDLGDTVTLTPRAPWVGDRAWLSTELVSTEPKANAYWMLAWPDAFAPAGSFDLHIQTQPGKRYLVECSMGLSGASSARGTIYAKPGPVREQIKQDAYTVAPNGGIVSVITPAGVTAPEVIVSFDIDAATIGATGLGILALDRCEVTPFAGG